MHTARKFNNGFSLVEMMGVAVLVIVLAALAAPSFQRAMAWYRLQSSANMIAAEMEAARVLAVSRGASYSLEFNSSSKTVTVVDIEDRSNPPRVPKQLERGVSFSSLPTRPIVFFPRGHASVAETVTVSNGEGQLQVAVLMSGKVTVGACAPQVQPGQSAGGTPSDGGSGSGTETQ